MENPIKMDDLGVPLFLETSICTKVGNHYEGHRVIHLSWMSGESPGNVICLLPKFSDIAVGLVHHFLEKCYNFT